MLNKWGRKLQQHYKERWTFMTKTKVLNVHGAIVGLEKVVPIGYEKASISWVEKNFQFFDIYWAVILRHSFALRVISDVLWSSCFENYGPKDTR